MTNLDRTKYLRDLRRKMAESFDLAEIKTLAFDLSIDWDYLSGDEKLTKIQSLIMHLARRGSLDDLITLLKEERPKVNWPEVPPSEQQIQDEGDITPDSVRDATLQDYLDKMNRFVVDKKLPKNPDDKKYDSATIATAQAYTDSVILRLDKSRLVIVIRYLSSINIISELNTTTVRITDLSGTNLEEIDLQSVNMQGVNFQSANLKSANLQGANLKESNLQGANLEGANLKEAELVRANLKGASLVGAILNTAGLEGADLKGADIKFALFSNAIYNEFTIFPEGFNMDYWDLCYGGV